MLRRVIHFATTRPKRVIALWAIVAIALGSVPALLGYKVISDDTALFLPKTSESAQATEYARTAFGQEKGTRTVSVLVKRKDSGALTAADRAEIRSLAAAMPGWRFDVERSTLENQAGDLRERAGMIVGAQLGPMAPGGRWQLVGLEWKGNTTDPVAQEFFRQVRDRAADRARSHDLRVGFTGGVASRADAMTAQEGRRLFSQILLLGSVVVLSLLFFRGPLAAVIPLLAIYLVAGGASGLVVLAALAFGFTLDVSTPQLITVVLVGIGVDHADARSRRGLEAAGLRDGIRDPARLAGHVLGAGPGAHRPGGAASVVAAPARRPRGGAPVRLGAFSLGPRGAPHPRRPSPLPAAPRARPASPGGALLRPRAELARVDRPPALV